MRRAATDTHVENVRVDTARGAGREQEPGERLCQTHDCVHSGAAESLLSGAGSSARCPAVTEGGGMGIGGLRGRGMCICITDSHHRTAEIIQCKAVILH